MLYEGRALAAKFFRADVSPDGRTEDELAVSCAVDHPRLTRAVAHIRDPPGLLLELVQGGWQGQGQGGGGGVCAHLGENLSAG